MTYCIEDYQFWYALIEGIKTTLILIFGFSLGYLYMRIKAYVRNKENG